MFSNFLVIQIYPEHSQKILKLTNFLEILCVMNKMKKYEEFLESKIEIKKLMKDLENI